MDLVDEQYAEALEARRQELVDAAAVYDKAEAAYSRKVDKWRKADKAERERHVKEVERIRGLKAEVDEAHRGYQRAAEARRAVMSEYVDLELVQRRDKIAADIRRLQSQEQDERDFAAMYDGAIRAGEVRTVKAPTMPRPKGGGPLPMEVEHREVSNPKRFKTKEARTMLESRRDHALLQAEEIKAKWEALQPKLERAEAELSHAIAEAFRRG